MFGPIWFGFRAARYSRRMIRYGSRRSYSRVPRYTHFGCTVRHLSADTRDRCEATPRYQRAAIDAQIRADDLAVARAAWSADHPILGWFRDYGLAIFILSVVALYILALVVL